MPQRELRRTLWRATVLAICLLTISGPTRLRAQAPSYFKALSIPPRSVGTCLAPDERSTHGARLGPMPRLVIARRAPNARREMSLVRDSIGAIRGFQDMVQVSTGLGASVGEAVLASLQPDGRVAGTLMRSEIHMAVSARQRFDSASLQRMRDSAKRTSSRTKLDTAGQSRVRVLAAWLAERCPA